MNNDVNLKIGADGSEAIAETDRIENAMSRWAKRVQEEIDEAGQSVGELSQGIQGAQVEADALQGKINADNARALQEVLDELAPSIRKGREELESLEEATESYENTVQHGNDKITAGRAALEKYEAVAKKVAIAYGVALGLVTAIQAAIESATGAQKEFNRAVENREGLERRAGFEKDRAGKIDLDNAKAAEDPVAQIEFLLASAEQKAKSERKRLAAARDERDDREGFFAANPRKFFGIDRDAGLTDRLEQGPKNVEEAEKRVFELRKARDEARAKVLKDQAAAEEKAVKDKQKADDKASKEKEALDKRAEKIANRKVEKQKELNKSLERELSILKEKELIAGGDKDGARKERNKRLSNERVEKFAALGKDKAVEAANALGAADGDRERAEVKKQILEDRQKQLDKLSKLEGKLGRDDERRVKKMNKLFAEQKKIRDEANRPLGGFDEGFDSLNKRISASANSPNETVEKLQGVQDKIDEAKTESTKERNKQVEAIKAVEAAVKKINVGMK